jgi:hypothetical protein
MPLLSSKAESARGEGGRQKNSGDEVADNTYVHCTVTVTVPFPGMGMGMGWHGMAWGKEIWGCCPSLKIDALAL